MNALSTPNDINKVFNYQIDKETYGVKERTNKVSSFFEREVFNMQQILHITDWKEIRSNGYWERLANIEAYAREKELTTNYKNQLKKKELYNRMRAYIEKKPELLLSYKNYLIRNGIEIPVE
jgi:hypothetical protein